MRRVLCMLLVLLSALPFVPAAGEQAFAAEIHLDERLAMIKHASYTIKGSLMLSEPADKIECVITDLLKNKVEYSKNIDVSDHATVFELSSIIHSSVFAKLSSGEKALCFRAYRGNLCVETTPVRFTVLGTPGEHASITRECTYESAMNPKFLWNGSYYHTNSWHATQGGNTLTFTLPDSVPAAIVQIEWTVPPSCFSIDGYDSDGVCIYTKACPEDYNLYCETFHLDEAVRKVTITLPDTDAAIAALHVFSQSAPVVDVQDWRPMPEKLDLMLISTHQDDELLFFGGSIPYYSASEYETGVVYVVNCKRYRYAEALSGLWIAGLKNHPVFLGYTDGVPEDYNTALSLWGGYDSVVESLVEQIRHYKPEVIVTHGEDGEYRHYQHIVTSNAVLTAVKDAADPEKWPESYNRYGVWNVQKLYRHQSFGDNVIHMNWETPMDEYDGRTPIEMSEIAYNRHESQISYLPYSFSDKYDNTAFALVYSTVGADIIGGDFFENVLP